MFEGYRISSNKDDWNQCFDLFKTKEDAIKEARHQYRQWRDNKATDLFDEFEDKNPPIHFYIGRSYSYDPLVDAEQVIYNIQENAYFEGGEYSEGYLENVKSEDIDKLSGMLTEVYCKWEKENGYKSNFFVVTKIEEHSLYLK